MKHIRCLIPSKKPFFILLAAVCALAMIFGAFAINAAQNDSGVEYIYLDLAAGNVKIQGSSYSGSVYKKDEGGAFTLVSVTGTIEANQAYYVYQSAGGSTSPDGYFVENADGTRSFTLPQVNRAFPEFV